LSSVSDQSESFLQALLMALISVDPKTI